MADLPENWLAPSLGLPQSDQGALSTSPSGLAVPAEERALVAAYRLKDLAADRAISRYGNSMRWRPVPTPFVSLLHILSAHGMENAG